MPASRGLYLAPVLTVLNVVFFSLKHTSYLLTTSDQQGGLERMKALFGLLPVLVICQFCNIDFTSIGRHQWRCKRKLNQGEGEQSNGTNMPFRNSHRNSVYERITLRQRTPVNENHIQCCCGKKCKGLRGLKSHHRSCCTIRGLNGNIFNELQAIDCIESETLVENALSVTTQTYDNSVKMEI